MSNSKAIYEGWMVRYGRRKIGRSFIHMRYFVLETRLLAYYKKKPQANAVPLKTLLIDGNCRVEDRGLKTQHGFKVYVLCIYNKKEKSNRITMAAFNIQEALVWKAKIETAIDQQHQEAMASGNKAYTSFEYKPGFDNGRTASSSDRDSQCSPDDEDEAQPSVLPETIIRNDMEDEEHKTALLRGTVENGLPDSVPDWTHEFNLEFSSQTNTDQAFSRKHWRLIRCQNGLRIFEELVEVDYLPRSFSKAMKAVGVVDATCEEVFELVMTMDSTRFEWDCSFNHGSVVEEVDGHTAVLYHRLMLDWFPMFAWPRDLCYVRYWRRNDDGSYVVLFRSRDHENCGQQPGYVRAHIESGGYKISPLKSRGGRPRTQVQNLIQIDLKGWGIGYFPSFQQHCVLQMLNSVAGLREWFAQTDNNHTVQRIPVMVNMSSKSASLRKDQKALPVTVRPSPRLDHATSRHSVLNDEFSEEDEELQIPESEPELVQEVDVTKLDVLSKSTVMVEGTSDVLHLNCFTGNLRRDDLDNSRDCWRISEAKNFKVRSKGFISDKSKVPAEKHLMELVAVDWFKDTKRMDHVARRKGCAVQVASERGMLSLAVNLQVPGTTHYSMVFYFVMSNLVAGSLLQRFFDGDDEFRNSRLKLIPSVPKGSWIVRQSVGSTPCILGKAVDITYIRGPKYLEIDVDIGSSAVANGVLGLVCGVITTLVVDMAFLVQANTIDELPEQLIGAVRVSHVELKSAVVPVLEENQPEGAYQ